MQETTDPWVQSLGVEDALEKEMATHSSLLAWEIPWTEELHFMKSQKSQTWVTDWTATAPTTFMQMVPVNFKTFVDQKEKKPTSILYPKSWTSCFLLSHADITFSCKYSWWLSFPKVINNYIERRIILHGAVLSGTWFWTVEAPTVSPEGHGKMFKLWIQLCDHWILLRSIFLFIFTYICFLLSISKKPEAL